MTVDQDTTTDVKKPDDKALRQDFGDNPIEVRETDHYQEEYIRGFVEKWDDLIDWEARARSEGQFFIDMLKANICDLAVSLEFIKTSPRSRCSDMSGYTCSENFEFSLGDDLNDPHQRIGTMHQ